MASALSAFWTSRLLGSKRRRASSRFARAFSRSYIHFSSSSRCSTRSFRALLMPERSVGAAIYPSLCRNQILAVNRHAQGCVVSVRRNDGRHVSGGARLVVVRRVCVGLAV